MAAAVRFKVDGLKQLEKQLARLETKVAAKALRTALQRVARPIVRDAKARAGSSAIRDSGALAASIGTFSKKGRKGQPFMTVSIGPKKRQKRALALYLAEHPERANADPDEQSGRVIRHGHLVEFGTSHGVPARPFLRPAFDKNVAGVVSGFRAELAASIAKLQRPTG